jgi:hypothetical protein
MSHLVLHPSGKAPEPSWVPPLVKDNLEDCEYTVSASEIHLNDWLYVILKVVFERDCVGGRSSE